MYILLYTVHLLQYADYFVFDDFLMKFDELPPTFTLRSRTAYENTAVFAPVMTPEEPKGRGQERAGLLIRGVLRDHMVNTPLIRPAIC